MGTQPILKLLISMSAPAMLSMFIQSMYNVVDSMYVGRLGEEALTAVSLAFPIQMLMIAFAVGTSIGVNSLISRKLGERKEKEAGQVASHGLYLSFFTYIVFALFGIFFAKAFIMSSNQDASLSLLKDSTSYLQIVTVFSFGCFIEIAIEKILQATGDMKHPMIMQLIGAVVNIILDPFFIFGWCGIPKLGVTGAAIATVIGQIIAMIYAIYILIRKEHTIKVKIKNVKLRLETIKNIYIVGLPAIVMQSITSFLIMILNKILGSITPPNETNAAISVLGVYFKLQSFVFMPVFGLNHGAMPIMGYNYGARNKKRLLGTLKISAIIATGICVVGTILFNLFPEALLKMFNGSESMMTLGVPALRIISLSFILAGVDIMISNYFQAIGKGFYSLFVSIMRQVVAILPFAYFMAPLLGVKAVWWAFPVSELVSLFFSGLMFMIIYKREIKYLK